ncbi:hypothetical protein EJ05DRAFT_183446 [Pseudovirgaria hyperparasitica]|uniref:Uncharacterized protein n=1 Tax=Pseudovirgaria hyperparasitica TaxID=470096 RepID=A0A6A6WFX0_9PEZI|nr:uncharacterized protein EJ05DRAFT_183446 [Pseudovirgaria hyperparasitica]KAF2761732.1 hypothetical protein EJ05DRAFT_183446 [Pseudovirgaria hyperparasitica]
MATSMAIGRLITPWDQAASELGQTHDAHDMTALQQDKRPRSQLRYTASTPSDLPSSLPCRRLSAAATEAAHADGHIAAPATPLSELQAGYQIQIHHRSPYAKPSLHHIHHAGFRYSDHTASSCAHGCADLEKYVPQHGPANHATEGSPVNASIRNASLHSRLRDTTTSLDGYIDDPRASHDHVRQEVNTSSAPEVQDAHGTQCPLIGYRDVSDKDAQDIRIPSSDIYLHQARTNGSSTSANTGSGLAEIHAIRPFVSTFKGSGCVGSPQRDTDSSTTHHHAQVSGFLNDVSYKGVLPSDRACLVNTSSPLDARQKPRGIKPGKTSTQVEQLVLKTAIDGQAAIHVPPRDSRSSSGASPFVSRSLSQSASANSTSSLTPRAATNNGLAVSIVPKRTHKKFLSPGSVGLLLS